MKPRHTATLFAWCCFAYALYAHNLYSLPAILLGILAYLIVLNAEGRKR